MTMPAEKVNVEKAAQKAPEKASGRVLEKRRALGRGLESLLPGPRVVVGAEFGRAGAPVAPSPDEQVATRVSPAAGEVAGATMAAAGDGETTPGGVAGAEPGTVTELRAMAAGRVVDGHPVLEIPLDQIDANPHQTRIHFNQEYLAELAESIRAQGVIQPIVVRPGKDGRYLLILGDRRVRASKMAGRTTIPAIMKRVSEQQAAEMTIVENLQRQDLHCLEQAEAFSHLSKHFGLTQEAIGRRVGLSREAVSNYLRLLKLPEQVMRYLASGELTYSHARELLHLDDESQILKVAEKAVKEKMSVMLLEELVLDVSMPLEKQGPEKVNWGGARWVDPNVRAAQRQLEAVLGMRVRIRDRRGKGKITIEYGSLEDFDRVVKMLKGK